MRRLPLFALFVLCASCTTRGPVAMSNRELKAMGTKSFDAQFEEVYDAAYLSLESHEGHISMASRLEGVIENDKVELSPPAGWEGRAYRNYAVSVYQDGARVAVTAVPRLWADDRDVSDEPRWVLPGADGEESHWERLFEGIDDLLNAWRDVPEMHVEKTRGEVTVLGVKLTVPPDFRGIELAVDRRSAYSQAVVRGAAGCADCPGGMNPTFVFEVSRRYPQPEAPKLELTALERALGPKLVTPEAWDVQDTQLGRRGVGQVVAGDPAKTVEVVWHVWDANEPAFMIRAASACGPPQTPAGCEAQWDTMIDGVYTPSRR